MSDTVPAPRFDSEASESPHYASFVLRCWTCETGQIRARLTDVHSGISYPVTDLADLPCLVRRMVTQTLGGENEG